MKQDDLISQTVEMLKRRGFLIDLIDDAYYLSDNSAPDDLPFLSDLLSDFSLGFVRTDTKGLEIVINPWRNPKALDALFLPIDRGSIGVGSCNQTQSWNKVRSRYHSPKIPVAWLEANIARYIKALSACGIYTGGCCDGNHPRCDQLYIEFDGPVYKDFHKWLWADWLDSLFSLQWNAEYVSIDLKYDRQEQYRVLNAAAEFIYDNRFFIQRIRMRAAASISKNQARKMSHDELAITFIQNCKRIFAGEKKNGNRL